MVYHQRTEKGKSAEDDDYPYIQAFAKRPKAKDYQNALSRDAHALLYEGHFLPGKLLNKEIIGSQHPEHHKKSVAHYIVLGSDKLHGRCLLYILWIFNR